MKMPTITTYSGRNVDVLNLQEEDIDVVDIAHALALCNRFAGHTRWPISVAQHSVGVSLLCHGVDGTDEALQGLFHDATEAYLGDVTKWLKESTYMAGYREVEAHANGVIMAALELPERLHETVLWADKLMCRYEYEIGFGRGMDIPGWTELTREERDSAVRLLERSKLWQPIMTWREAESVFLARLADLRR
jgi:hypothetical protein